MASGDTKTQQYLDIAANGTRADIQRGCCDTRTQTLILDVAERIIAEEENREAADNAIQEEIDEIKNNPDVVDVVSTYQDLQDYDKTTLTDKDIIRVLEDSTHDDDGSYYRYDASTQTFTYIGSAGGGVNVVQTIGNSTTDVMSQNAVTEMVYVRTPNDPSVIDSVRIGDGASADFRSAVAIGKDASAVSPYTVAVGDYSSASSSDSTALGHSAHAGGAYSVALGHEANAGGSTSVAIGYLASVAGGTYASVAIGPTITNARYPASVPAGMHGSIALGMGARVSSVGEMNIGDRSSRYGYNGSAYRLLTGLYDPQSAHDAATKGYVDALLGDKQDTLTAGNGITLTGATISADTTVLATKEEAVGTTEAYTIAAADWQAVADATPYAYSATVTATYTIGANTLVELYNDAPVAFANYGFAIESINGQALTIYAIEAPTASTTLKVNYKETA